MEDQEYINPFRDVHRRAKALRERALEELKKDEELRKEKQIQETESLLKAGSTFSYSRLSLSRQPPPVASV